jgi:hypothetical protein
MLAPQLDVSSRPHQAYVMAVAKAVEQTKRRRLERAPQLRRVTVELKVFLPPVSHVMSEGGDVNLIS